LKSEYLGIILGQCYNRLTADSFIRIPNKAGYLETKVKCICRCGNETIVRLSELRNGVVKSCGCLIHDQSDRARPHRLPFGEAAGKALYRNYKNSAKLRGYSFSLSEYDFLQFTKRNCHYCGREPSNKHYTSWKITGYYLFNGVDRINNNIGYVKNNCVPCCKNCNMMKRDLTTEEFITTAIMIANKNKGSTK
jgi:hypothetical protein